VLRALVPLLLALACLPGAHALPAPATAPVLAVGGVAFGTMEACPAGDELAIHGASDGDGTWTFVVARTDGMPNLDCPIAQAGVFQGAWDPAVGGCIGSVVTTDADGFCLGPVNAGSTTSWYELCRGFFSGAGCHGCSIGTFTGAAA
jgi:hypothetical protein